MKSGFEGEQAESNHRLVYTWAWPSPQKWRASPAIAHLAAAAQNVKRLVRFLSNSGAIAHKWFCQKTNRLLRSITPPKP
jgi:hypothetical protein